MSTKTMPPKQMDDLKWLVSKIRDLMDRNFHGEITISFHAGTATKLDTMQRELPPSKLKEKNAT